MLKQAKGNNNNQVKTSTNYDVLMVIKIEYF